MKKLLLMAHDGIVAHPLGLVARSPESLRRALGASGFAAEAVDYDWHGVIDELVHDGQTVTYRPVAFSLTELPCFL